MFTVNDKIVVVTGGASGIGACITEEFIKEGAKSVIFLDINSEAGLDLEKMLNEKYETSRCTFKLCDVTQDLKKIYDEILNQFGYVDVLVNNAGRVADNPETCVLGINLNFTALVTASLKGYNSMRKDQGFNGGTIINVASGLALIRNCHCLIYGATKSAVLYFSNCLGMEPHYNRSGVRVVTICFGLTNTQMIHNVKSIDEESSKAARECFDRLEPQSAKYAANGLLEAYKHGSSGSTWLVSKDNIKDVTEAVNKMYDLMKDAIVEDV